MAVTFFVPYIASVQVTGPPAVPVRSIDPRGPEFEFTTAAAGTLRLTMTWQQELFDSRSNLVGVCAVTAPIDLAVLNPRPPKLTARFLSHLVFELRLSNRVDPLDTRSVTVLLRIRRGRATPPSARGRSAARYTFSAEGFSGGSKQHTIFNVATFEARGTNGATLVGVIPDTTGLRPGRQLRFGFSVEVRQGGRRIGGMRSGVICHLKLTRLGAEPRCSHPGFRGRP